MARRGPTSRLISGGAKQNGHSRASNGRPPTAVAVVVAELADLGARSASHEPLTQQVPSLAVAAQAGERLKAEGKSEPFSLLRALAWPAGRGRRTKELRAFDTNDDDDDDAVRLNSHTRRGRSSACAPTISSLNSAQQQPARLGSGRTWAARSAHFELLARSPPART